MLISISAAVREVVADLTNVYRTVGTMYSDTLEIKDKATAVAETSINILATRIAAGRIKGAGTYTNTPATKTEADRIKGAGTYTNTPATKTEADRIKGAGMYTNIPATKV
jgi:hypothetical protein